MIFNVQCSFQTRAYLTSISFNALQTQPTIPCFDAMAVSKANYLRVDARQSCKIFGSCENLQTLRPKNLNQNGVVIPCREVPGSKQFHQFPDGGLLHSLAADEELMNAINAMVEFSIRHKGTSIP
jgi:hypothetical protein